MIDQCYCMIPSSKTRLITYYLLTKRGQYIKSKVWDFPVLTEQMRLKSYLFCDLFIMDLSLWSIETNSWSANNFKKNLSPQWVVYLIPWYSQMVSRYPFDSCRLTITWMSIRMSTIKLNTDLYYALDTQLGNARSLQEKSQWERVFSCSHTIIHFDQYNNLNWADCELLLLVILMVFFTKDTRHVGHKTNSA